MSIIDIEARFHCDECGAVFNCGIDPAYTPPSGWSMMDVAEDAVRGGIFISIQDDKHLCHICTDKADKEGE